jgi:hypothetical protein
MSCQGKIVAPRTRSGDSNFLSFISDLQWCRRRESNCGPTDYESGQTARVEWQTGESEPLVRLPGKATPNFGATTITGAEARLDTHATHVIGTDLRSSTRRSLGRATAPGRDQQLGGTAVRLSHRAPANAGVGPLSGRMPQRWSTLQGSASVRRESRLL